VAEPDEEARYRRPRCGRRGKPVETAVQRGGPWTCTASGASSSRRCRALPAGEHGKVTAAVPWARHDDRFTMPFEEHAAWCYPHMPWTKVAAQLRVTWEALAGIVARAATDGRARPGRLEGLRRIGIDEKSRGKGAGKYLTVVTDHDSGRIAWMAEGRNQDTVRAFFDALGQERAALLAHMSADGAGWIHAVVRARAPPGPGPAAPASPRQHR